MVLNLTVYVRNAIFFFYKQKNLVTVGYLELFWWKIQQFNTIIMFNFKFLKGSAKQY